VREDFRSATAKVIEDLKAVEEHFSIKLGPRNLTQQRYENMINDFLIAFIEQNRQDAQKCLVEAAKIRKCLG
jgi:phosphoenolpyruvate carboxylase